MAKAFVWNPYNVLTRMHKEKGELLYATTNTKTQDFRYVQLLYIIYLIIIL